MEERSSPSLRAISAMERSIRVVEIGSSTIRPGSPKKPPTAPLARTIARWINRNGLPWLLFSILSIQSFMMSSSPLPPGRQALTMKIGQVLRYGNGYEARFLYQANGYGVRRSYRSQKPD